MSDLVFDFGGFEVEVREGKVFDGESELRGWYRGRCCGHGEVDDVVRLMEDLFAGMA